MHVWNRKKRKTTLWSGVVTGSQEEVEEIGFVPSAVSEPLWALHVCDNECREQGFKYFQLAAIVSEGGGAVHTINLCKQCCNGRRVQQGEQPVKAAPWWNNGRKERIVASCGRYLVWNSLCAECGSISPYKGHGPK